jgi:hypothetical protein
MKALAWFLALLIVGGIIFYGLAKIVLITVLVGGGLFFGSAMVCGISEAFTKRRPAKTTSVIAQSHALAGRAVVQDDELLRLRRMAGLSDF